MPGIRVFTIFASLPREFYFKLHRMIAWSNFELLAEKKLKKKLFGLKFGPNEPKLDPKLVLLLFSQVCFINSLLNCLS